MEIVRAEGSSKLSQSKSSKRLVRPTDALSPAQHYPAFTAALFAPVDDYYPAPLAQISMGDHLS